MIEFSSSISSSVIWCVIQVSMIVGIGVVSAWLFSRRNPFVASSIAYASVTVSMLLTFFAPLTIHRVVDLGSQDLLSPIAELPQKQSRPIAGQNRPLENPLPHTERSPERRAFWIDLQSAAVAVRSLVKSAKSLESGPAFHWGGLIFAAMIFTGLAKFIAGLAFTFRIRRDSARITDIQMACLLDDVASRLEYRKSVELREHREFTDAAVAGWIRPLLLLPKQWREWNDDELRSVIAHELAHIMRHDLYWRVVTSILSAIHFYNPLVTLLSRRVTFYQELAADALAASVIGPKVYLRSLSSLAIRHDDLSRSNVTPNMLPVFSGHLIRRIKVLNSKDGDSMATDQTKQGWRSATISMVFFVLGFASLVTRGIADPPNGDKPSKNSVASEPAKGKLDFVSSGKVDVVSFNVTTPRPETDPTKEMFKHSQFPADLGPHHPDGMMVVRVNELLHHPEMRQYNSALNDIVSNFLSESLGSPKVPDVRLESIAWIAATPSFSIVESKNQTPDQGDRNHRLMMGAGGAMIKFNEPVNLADWMDRFAKNPKKHALNDRTVFELNLPFLGPLPCFIWQSAEDTLQTMAYTREFPPKQASTLDDVAAWIKSNENRSGTDSYAWAPTWNRTGTGLISIVLCSADLSGINDKFDEKCEKEGPLGIAMGNFARELRKHCKTTAVHLDLANESSEIGIRFTFAHASRDSAEHIGKQLEELSELVKTELANQFKKLDSSNPKHAGDIARNRLLEHGFRMGYGSVTEHPDGTASLDVSTVIPISKLVDALSHDD